MPNSNANKTRPKSLKSGFNNYLNKLSILILCTHASSTLGASLDSPRFQFSVPATLRTTAQEFLLKLNYSIHCDEINDAPENNNWFHGLHGLLTTGTSQIRVDLFETQAELEVNLGRPARNAVTLNLEPNSHCTLENLFGVVEITSSSNAANSARNGDYSALALQNSPFIGIREDEYENRNTDLPLFLAYRVYHNKKNGNAVMDYVVYFTDEDSGSTRKSKENAMGGYGRSSDIEWVYRVEFDPEWNVIKKTYQSTAYFFGIPLGLGHSTKKFKGESIEGHPVVYNTYKNNIFMDLPRGHQQKISKVTYQLVPRKKLDYNEAIENVVFENPWMAKLTEQEQTLENKAPAPVLDHLFVEVVGEMKGKGPLGTGIFTGKYSVQIKTADQNGASEIFLSEGYGVNRSEIQGDTWLRRSLVSAVKINRQAINQIVTGKSSGILNFIAKGKPDLRVRTIRVFRIVNRILNSKFDGFSDNSYKTEELTSLFRCNLNGVQSTCVFGNLPLH